MKSKLIVLAVATAVVLPSLAKAEGDGDTTPAVVPKVIATEKYVRSAVAYTKGYADQKATAAAAAVKNEAVSAATTAAATSATEAAASATAAATSASNAATAATNAATAALAGKQDKLTDTDRASGKVLTVGSDGTSLTWQAVEEPDLDGYATTNDLNDKLDEKQDDLDVPTEDADAGKVLTAKGGGDTEWKDLGLSNYSKTSDMDTAIANTKTEMASTYLKQTDASTTYIAKSALPTTEGAVFYDKAENKYIAMTLTGDSYSDVVQ
jgi:hypothetical protein